MTTVTITCDRCKKSAERSEDKQHLDVRRVAVGVWEERYSNRSFNTEDITHSADWCGTCRNELGLLFHRDDVKPEPHYPTLEDLIREIAKEAATDAVQNQ